MALPRFTLKALSPAEREQAEIRAGAMTRSELGRLLWSEAPDDPREKAGGIMNSVMMSA